MNVAQETLGFRRQGLSPCLSLLMSAFALPISPASLSTHLHRLTERSSTTPSNPSSQLHNSHLSIFQRRQRRLIALHAPICCDCLNLWRRFVTRATRERARPSSQN